ncbi:MAG: cytochrome C [Rhodospirillaceae bacterium]|jgi:ubiquinol-cytochrome c reductase cytochrome b/c1 subunit|nr:cytochrome C [Rhodospirillaceae bacterium]MBT6139925.1 cytochrome C [Rhodospirillaceae bacterium]
MSGPNFPNPIVRWIDHRLPVFTFMHHEMHEYPTPKNLNYWWNFGSLAGIMLVIMLVSGITLAMSYTPHTSMAFDSVERIMRDVNFGWLIRYIHSNGGSFFFIAVYIHIFRGMYYGSYKAPRELLWLLGVVIMLLMMATAFMGYVLPWGQMSFWGATVITNLFSAIPLVGEDIVTLLWGGFSVDNPTLNRFFSLHYLMPFVIVGVVVLHLVALHRFGSNNPLGIDTKGPQDSIPFHPYYTIKDAYGLGVFLVIFAGFVFYAPNFLGEPDNYIPANPLVTPSHIVPEWYFLPFYAILRAVPDKLLGVVMMFASIAMLFILPWLDRSPVRSGSFRPVFRIFFWVLFADCLLLGYLGAKPASGIYVVLARLGTAYYFAHFVILLPLLSIFETPRPLPKSISQAVTSKGTAAVIAALILVGGLGLGGTPAKASGGDIPKQDWSFSGPFGTFDRGELQRGFQVFKDTCAGCHGLKYIAFRNLAALGYNELEVKAIAAEYEVLDVPNEEGEVLMRPARASDRWPSPFANDNAARASNGGALPPDLSLMAKARIGGPDYLYALMTGYTEAPADFSLSDGMSYHIYFGGNQIAMPPPLFEDGTEYSDGTKATVDQQARDITAFLMWAAEPSLEDRNRMGFKVILFLLVLTVMLYFSKRKIWASVH